MSTRPVLLYFSLFLLDLIRTFMVRYALPVCPLHITDLSFFCQIALEELAERVNGDIRLAVNQLQYMSLSMSVIKYDDIRQRLLSSAKDEDISPFTAVDK